MPDSHSLSAHGDIWPDQPDVPALYRWKKIRHGVNALRFRIIRCVRRYNAFKAQIGDLHMCAPDSFRSARCLLRGCPDEGHANDQLTFPDRNTKI